MIFPPSYFQTPLTSHLRPVNGVIMIKVAVFFPSAATVAAPVTWLLSYRLGSLQHFWLMGWTSSLSAAAAAASWRLQKLLNADTQQSFNYTVLLSLFQPPQAALFWIRVLCVSRLSTSCYGSPVSVFNGSVFGGCLWFGCFKQRGSRVRAAAGFPSAHPNADVGLMPTCLQIYQHKI